MENVSSVNPNPLPLVFEQKRGRVKPPRHLADLSADERTAVAEALGEPAFRVKQVANHYYARLERDPANMTDLPAASRDRIVAELLPTLLNPVRTHGGRQGHDGQVALEAVRRSARRVGPDALHRSRHDLRLQPGRLRHGVPVLRHRPGRPRAQHELPPRSSTRSSDAAGKMARGKVAGGPGRLSNVVFMGMGEPMANYKAVIGAVRRMVAPAPDGLGMSARNITVSTVGLVPRMKQLADEGIPVTLALSLHAPDDELRNELVPINTRWSVHEAVEAAWEYAQKTKRRVSIEYAMIKDINDQAWRADLLGDVLQSYGDWGWVHVNLIPLNPTPGSMWTASRPEDEREFVRRLIAKGIPTTVRDTRGSDIDGACGQLAAAE